LSHTFKSGFIPDDKDTLIAFLRNELARLQQALNEAQPEYTFQVRNVAPTKTWAGMSVYADGTNWNPGSGQGVYVRDKDNAAWRHLG